MHLLINYILDFIHKLENSTDLNLTTFIIYKEKWNMWLATTKLDYRSDTKRRSMW